MTITLLQCPSLTCRLLKKGERKFWEIRARTSRALSHVSGARGDDPDAQPNTPLPPPPPLPSSQTCQTVFVESHPSARSTGHSLEHLDSASVSEHEMGGFLLLLLAYVLGGLTLLPLLGLAFCTSTLLGTRRNALLLLS